MVVWLICVSVWLFLSMVNTVIVYLYNRGQEFNKDGHILFLVSTLFGPIMTLIVITAVASVLKEEYLKRRSK